MGRRRINKSEKIRRALESLGFEARSKDVVAALKSQRVSVSPAQVANVRSRMSAMGSIAKRRNGQDKIAVAALLSAKELLAEAGSVEAARHTLDALAKLL